MSHHFKFLIIICYLFSFSQGTRNYNIEFHQSTIVVITHNFDTYFFCFQIVFFFFFLLYFKNILFVCRIKAEFTMMWIMNNSRAR